MDEIISQFPEIDWEDQPFDNDYEILENVGKGKNVQSKCYLARNKHTKNMFMAKVYEKKTLDDESKVYSVLNNI